MLLFDVSVLNSRDNKMCIIRQESCALHAVRGSCSLSINSKLVIRLLQIILCESDVKGWCA